MDSAVPTVVPICKHTVWRICPYHATTSPQVMPSKIAANRVQIDYPRVRKRGVGKSTFSLKNKVIDLLKCQILLLQSRISLQKTCKKYFLKSCPTDLQIVPSGRPPAWSRRWGPWAGVVRSLGGFQWKMVENCWISMGFTGLHQLSVGDSYQVSLQTAWRVFVCVWSTVSCHCSFSDADSETKILKKVENDLRLFKQIGGVNTVENLGQVRPESIGWAVVNLGFTNGLCCYYRCANLQAYSLETLSLPCNHLTTSDAIKNSCKSGSDWLSSGKETSLWKIRMCGLVWGPFEATYFTLLKAWPLGQVRVPLINPEDVPPGVADLRVGGCYIWYIWGWAPVR